MQAHPTIFSVDSAKAIKAQDYGYLNAIHYMAPHRSGLLKGTLCSHASDSCIRLCLGKYSGQAAMVADLENGVNSVRVSRTLKAQLFMSNPTGYLREVYKAIRRLIHKARKMLLTPVIRLNGSTDIPWERIKLQDGRTIFAHFPLVQFVDYTKNPSRLGHGIPNYHLTLSYSGANWPACAKALFDGHNVAMIFGAALPDRMQGFRVINGDIHDLRHLDPRGVIVGLTPKGLKAKRTDTPFIVRGGVFA